MPTPKKTPQELELAAHNRLKGTICFHVQSALSQLGVIENKLRLYYNGCDCSIEQIQVNRLIDTVHHLYRATNNFKSTAYSKLEIGN